ncbi:hypothetical protein KFL_003250200 [Klebsormidium nitens]|uniref:Uncharacterized protein n=1 Tax=Klebsormidium nitens TaxID=105231 RepID=A0A1Y1IE80_KLENI|nr:hypothetical protein KFL_003250200 [Klebsormidium nitens]|eukprot:GAQ87016.1 hypothetical protein KFL_003250200 [Klebsormidium nitens]
MEDVGNLVAGPLWNQTRLSLHFRGLSGPIPRELGSLTNLTYLDLSLNSLSGPIPPELGSLTNLTYLDLSLNSLSGPIPPELGSLTKLSILALGYNDLFGLIPLELDRLASLQYLNLTSNNLSGPIPSKLSGLTGLQKLDLSFNNHISGPIPPELGGLTGLQKLDLSFNNLSGPIPTELGSLTDIETLNLSSTDTSCEMLDLSRMTRIQKLGLPCSPPLSFKETNLSYLALTVNTQSSPAKYLDLSAVPDSCKIVNLTGLHPNLERVRFWGACNEGCVVNLAGTGARLDRSTRGKVCLSRISVFLSGDIPFPLYDRGKFLGILQNQRGNYSLDDPNFVDLIDLGRDGRAYTGVGFSRVQAGNLCGNPEAKGVTALVFGVFTVLLLVGTISVVVVAPWRRRIRGSGLEEDGAVKSGLRRGGLYLWGVALGVLPVVDVVTDFLVLSEVWGAWPMWVVLASVCAPFVWASYAVAESWSSTKISVRGLKGLRVRWMWPLPDMGAQQRRANALSLRAGVLAVLLLPLGLLGVLVQDLLSVAERFGLHLASGDEIVVFERYHESRVVVEVLLESLPQAIFQTGLYLIGSSRATRIYIDQRIFVQSIVVSLCSLLMHYCTMLWEAVYEGKSIVRVFLDRFRGAGQPISVALTTGPSGDEEVEVVSLKAAG